MPEDTGSCQVGVDVATKRKDRDVGDPGGPRPLITERTFQIRAAIRKAGFRPVGRVKLDSKGRIVMGVVVPLTFRDRELRDGDTSREHILFALKEKAEELCEGLEAPYVRPKGGRKTLEPVK